MTALLVLAVLANPNPVLFGLERRHGIAVRCGDAPVSVFADVKFTNLDASDSDEVRRYAYLLGTELSKYPTSLVRAAGLRQVALVKDLTLDALTVGGIGDYKQEILYIDLYASKNNQAFRRHIVHHELFHLLEQEQNGTAYFKDPEWIALNPQGFRYGDGGLSVRSAEAMEIGSGEAGFLNRYCMAGIEEDRAETFAALMTPSVAQKAQRLAYQDPIVAAKLELIQGFVLRCSPEAGTDFFRRAAKSPQRT